MKIYKASIEYAEYDYLHEDFAKGESSRIYNNWKLNDKFHSSKENAFAALKKELEDTQDKRLLSLSIEEFELDGDGWEIQFYDLDLNETYSYAGDDYVVDNPKYDKGDWVIFRGGSGVEVGLIGHQCEGEEPYFIFTEGTFLNDSDPHDHTHEHLILMKIDENEAKRMLPGKFFYNIKRRFDYYNLMDEIRKKENS